MYANLATQFLLKLGDNLGLDLKLDPKDIKQLADQLQSLGISLDLRDPSETQFIIQTVVELYHLFFTWPLKTQADIFDPQRPFPTRQLAHLRSQIPIDRESSFLKRFLIIALKTGADAPTKIKRDYKASLYPTLGQAPNYSQKVPGQGGGHLYDPTTFSPSSARYRELQMAKSLTKKDSPGQEGGHLYDPTKGILYLTKSVPTRDPHLRG